MQFEAWLGLQVLVTAVLVGLIATVQVVHYPLFHFIDRQQFSEAHRFHTRRISLVVIPLMLLELGLAAASLIYFPELRSDFAYGASVVLLGVVWLSTFFGQVPLHRRLAHGFDAALIDGLVRSNWLRTIAWLARLGALVVAMVGIALAPR